MPGGHPLARPEFGHHQIEARGRVVDWRVNPHGDIDGFVVEAGAAVVPVHFPPHLGRAAVGVVALGEHVVVRGVEHTAPHGERLLAANTIESARGRVDVDVARPGFHRHHVPGAGHVRLDELAPGPGPAAPPSAPPSDTGFDARPLAVRFDELTRRLDGVEALVRSLLERAGRDEGRETEPPPDDEAASTN